MDQVTPEQMKRHLKVPGTYLIAGMSNSGKTVGTKKLLQLMPERFDRIVVFSQTARMTHDWDPVTPYIYDEPDYALVAKIQTFLEDRKANSRPGQRLLQVAFVFDDCAGVLETQERTHPMNRLVTMSRHYGISLFFLVQAMTQISPVIRKNAHYVVVTKVHGTDYDLLYSLQTHYDNKKDFITALRASMKDYNLIAFNMDCYTEKPVMVLSGRYKLRSRQDPSCLTDPQSQTEPQDRADACSLPEAAAGHDCGL